MTPKDLVVEILSRADVKIGGERPWDIQINNERFYGRVLRGGSFALGESYMDGWWDCEKLDEFFGKILRARLENTRLPLSTIPLYLHSVLFNRQTRASSKKAIAQHYDLSPKLYESFLDPYNQYTCGYFKGTDDLNTAQEQKLDFICRKLKLSPEDRVLDIGSGWGGFAKFASQKYGCHVTGITISKEQAAYSREYTKDLPVEIKILDYRDLSGTYDKILVCGMIEHVGYKNYSDLMRVVHKSLSDDGLFLLHTIGGNEFSTHMDPWLDKYIFPKSMLPSASQLSVVYEGLFVMEDWHNFGAYYDPTLMAWSKNFDKNWDNIKADYDQRFYRMWKYYLLSCAGLFRARKNQLWQIVFSKKGVSGGYQSIR